MLRSIFFKEYLKIRNPWLVLLALNGLLMVYIAIDTRYLFVMDHAEIVWYRTLQLGQIHYHHLKYAPLLTGLLIACIQYLPEMTNERLRLALHLPVSPHRLILAHIVVGLTALGIVILLDLTVLALLTARFFPSEAVTTSLVSALPWAMAGAAAYLGATLGMLEPAFRQKLFNLVLSAGVTGLFLCPAPPGGYLRLLPLISLPVVLMVPAVLLPAYRFRYRRIAS